MRRHSFDPSCPIVIIDENNLWQGFREWMQTELVVRGLWHGNEYNKLSFVRSADEAIDILSKRLPQVP